MEAQKCQGLAFQPKETTFNMGGSLTRGCVQG